MSEIPDRVDVIILGTSLTNSIIAAACSRIGKSVLHLDKNNYYGDDWASFTFQQLIDWIKMNHPHNPSLESISDQLINKSRMFCIDLAPRFLYSNGPMVDLLVKSNVARYHEFKNNIRILCMVDDDIHVMPCRRNEVFTSPLLSNLADKRRLMKFIELCVKYNFDESTTTGDAMGQESEINSNSDKPIGVFLEEKGLKPLLREYIINSIAMVRPTDSTKEACQRIKKFMIATERYGRSPFLFPLYGCGEFPQSFCRLSAVFGGIYCLNTKIYDVKMNTKNELPTNNSEQTQNMIGDFEVKFSSCEHAVKSDMLVIDYNCAIELNLVKMPDISDKLSRAILITKKSIVPNDENNDFVSFLRIPPSDKDTNLVFVLEFNSSALVCPKGLNILYLWTKASLEKPENDLKPTVERIFKDNSECIIWEFYYHQLIKPQQDLTKMDQSAKVPGLQITSPPCDDIDYSGNLEEAERLFHQMCPDQEFLPRAPDPDEIIST